MAHLKIHSTNPSLSFILKKNPSSGMSAIDHKEGVMLGWYNTHNPQEYHVFFKDQGHSYDKEKDYNNVGSFVSPLFVLDAITEFFNENLKKHHEKDTEGFDHVITVNATAFANLKILNSFKKCFPEVSLTFDETSHIKQIKISSSKPLHYLINYTALLFALIELRKTDLYVDGSLLTKYLHCLNRVDAPYFIRYLFKSHLLRHPEDFKAAEEIINNQKFNFTPGDNYMSRVRAVQAFINKDLPVIDIGCGEGRFMNFLTDRVPLYVGFDKSSEELQKSQARLEKYELKNVELCVSQDSFNTKISAMPQYQAILVEVIEHMPLSDAQELLNKTLNQPGLEKLFVSTPDRNFNKHYHIDTFRHDDHHFEFTEAEFQQWVSEITPANYKVNFIKIGDSIEGVATTVGAIFNKIKPLP